jgi:hypothetical protein
MVSDQNTCTYSPLADTPAWHSDRQESLHTADGPTDYLGQVTVTSV